MKEGWWGGGGCVGGVLGWWWGFVGGVGGVFGFLLCWGGVGGGVCFGNPTLKKTRPKHRKETTKSIDWENAVSAGKGKIS